MNRTVFSLPAQSDYTTAGGLAVTRSIEHFNGGSRLDNLIDLLDRRRGLVLSSGSTVPGRYESFDLGFADAPLKLETTGLNFSIEATNARGEVLIAFLNDTLNEPCAVITERTPPRLAGHLVRRAPPVDADRRARRARASISRGCLLVVFERAGRRGLAGRGPYGRRAGTVRCRRMLPGRGIHVR